MITIDGSLGEGGGQIIRSSLALSLTTGKSVKVVNVRANRKPPGLKRQHVTCVRAAAEVGAAKVRGADLGSSEFTFEPTELNAGEYEFKIGTAGSTTLVLQTVLPALLSAGGESTVAVEGGTHNIFAPPYDFFAKSYLPQVARVGGQVRTDLVRHGFYPAGGGRIESQIQPASPWKGVDLMERGKQQQIRVRALVSKLPAHIAERECDTIVRKSGWRAGWCSTEVIEDALSPGNVVMIEIEFEHITEVITAYGEKKIPAERVATKAWKAAQAYLKSGAPVGEYLADQLLLPLGLAAAQGNESKFRTGPLSLHAETHINVLKKFLSIEIEVNTKGDDRVVTLRPLD